MSVLHFMLITHLSLTPCFSYVSVLHFMLFTQIFEYHFSAAWHLLPFNLCQKFVFEEFLPSNIVIISSYPYWPFVILLLRTITQSCWIFDSKAWTVQLSQGSFLAVCQLESLDRIRSDLNYHRGLSLNSVAAKDDSSAWIFDWIWSQLLR